MLRALRATAVGASIVALSAAAAGCSTTKAATPLERPALEVPPPPPRVITPLPPPEAPALDPVGDLPANANTAAPPRPRPQQRDRNEPAKPDPKPETPPDQPATPPPAPPQQGPLRIPETSNPQQLAAQIRDTIARARGILDRTDYGPLSNARKKAYDDAKLFAQQADDALKASNLVFAKELADKAERLAKELQGR
ncbi:MAG TPA: hypothetical protein VM364_03645 [Vicinamibacterales bacterium]|nr:hypothetical protein [Vicinamibacterales bacterium]